MTPPEIEAKWRAEFEEQCQIKTMVAHQWHGYLAACRKREAEAEALRAENKRLRMSGYRCCWKRQQ